MNKLKYSKTLKHLIDFFKPKEIFKNLKRLSLITIVYVVIINIWIDIQAKNSTYNDVNQIPKNKVGLILGASKFTSYGSINLYYKYRLEAALALFKAGKIEFILISGDNGRKEYDEPTDFKNDLIKRGVPESKIYLDYAGFRTLDSVIRAKEIFGLSSVTLISQRFHNERALYLTRHFDIEAVAFNAKDIKGKYGIKTRAREYLARTKASIDLLFNVQPKYLGKKIEIV
ncbi:SanA/YdcF family protein [Seonamhaeicola maritimus]|uniref:Vancomycin high temperature exclusion protein n=1 Tax=Seonamhaeicola maritimus TaxID=2591822 RepID=A0A5C7GKF8_9FLAO|nr:ElyC/SanA/YdcF family protein [Seonamhaeicola maritimus]TXG38760.1 vancomycin high temperature exclusion protein [Seonamhaeicola maritimus]